MSHDIELADLTARIKKAESDQAFWRARGNQEKYLQAYFLAEALELQRGKRHSQGATAESRAAVSPAEAIPASREQLMAQYAITLDADRKYHLGPYRYDRLDDALAYARLMERSSRPVA